MKIFVPNKNSFIEYDVVENGEILKVSNGTNLFHINLKRLNNDLYSLLIDNQSYMIEAIQGDGEIRIIMNQQEYVIPVLSEREKIEAEILGASAFSVTKREIRAPMPGLILRIEVKKGEAIQPGQPLMIMEAMKMENEIRSQMSGEIQDILVQENQKVEKNDLLLKIQ